MEDNASDLRSASLNVGLSTSSPRRTWSRIRSIRMPSADIKSNQPEAETNALDSNDLEQSRFVTRTDLVYVRPTKIPSLDEEAFSFPSSGSSNNRMEDGPRGSQPRHLNTDQAQSGLSDDGFSNG